MKATIKSIQGAYAECVTEKGDRVIIKMMDPSQHNVGEEADWWTEYAATKQDGTIIYEEVVAPAYIDKDGNKQEAPERGSIPDTQYIIGFLEALAVSVFDAANIEMDLETIKMLAADRAVKNMQRGQL
jgi:hypothetical protein